MRRQYSVKRGVRPRNIRRSGHGAAASARLFMCAECRAQALICSCCDRGQIYCAGDCAARARRRTRRDAGRRYQTSRRGRLAHAERSRRYRVRCKNVTHHGSPPSPPDDLLSFGSPAIASDARHDLMDVLHPGVREEAQEDLARVAEHHDERHQWPPRAADLEMAEMSPTRRRCWSASRSRSARRPMSASTSTIIRSRTRMSGAFLLCRSP